MPILADNKTNRWYYISDSFRNAESLVDELNILIDENIDLKQNNQLLRKNNEQLGVELKQCQDFRDWVFKELEKYHNDKGVDI